MVTTLETSVAKYAGSNSSHHQMHLLNEDDSWDLLRRKVFAQETCPPELEIIGKRIANNCRGLPLAIDVIGGVLSQAKRRKESWVQVAEDVTSVVANNDEQVAKILSLSYNHLPSHLKPCFLYMSVFPEDYEIRSSKLVRLWVAEGFLEPVSGKSFEETAEMYLKSLVDRNLISICRQETNEIVKSYSMHDIMKDLCVRKAAEEKFVYIKNWPVRELPKDRPCARRVSIHSSDSPVELMSLARSFIWVVSGPWDKILPHVFFASRLLRVLDLLGIVLYEFPEEMLQLINLRYLALAYHSSLLLLPSSLSALWNLQTVIFRQYSSSASPFEAEHDIIMVGVPQLRHIKFQNEYPYYEVPEGESFVLQENLQTLSGVRVRSGSDRMIESVPNLKKLGIICSSACSLNLTCVSKLETLKLSSTTYFLRPGESVLSFLILPPSLRRLTLHKCRIPVGYMNEIGSLPNLEVLKLRDSHMESSTWEPTEGEFSRLQFLLLENLNLVKWEADETHFPRLERLVIQDCSELEEIPSGIGEISALEIIEVHNSSFSAVASARKIHKEQLELGNDGLHILITGRYGAKPVVEITPEMIEEYKSRFSAAASAGKIQIHEKSRFSAAASAGKIQINGKRLELGDIIGGAYQNDNFGL